jgi:enamine deaminase RidA (YjgF/YER057c/UK114 family)
MPTGRHFDEPTIYCATEPFEQSTDWENSKRAMRCRGWRAGQLLFMAGQVGSDPNLNVVEGKEAQFVQAFESEKTVMSVAGATFDEMADMVTYYTDMRDLQLFMSIKDRYYTGEYPAWTGIGVTSLAMLGRSNASRCSSSSEAAASTLSGGSGRAEFH